MPLICRPLTRRIATLLVGLAALWVLLAGAFEQLELDLGSLEGAGWRAEGVHLALDWPAPQATAYRLEIKRLTLPGLAQPLEAVTVDCPRGELSDARFACREGRLHLPHPQLDAPDLTLGFEYAQGSGTLSGRLEGVALAGGVARLDFTLDKGQWRAEVNASRLRLRALLALQPGWSKLLAGWEYGARVELRAWLAGVDAEMRQVRWQGGVRGLSFGDPQGSYVGEGLAAGFSGQLRSAQGNWRIDASLTLEKGELLTPYVYLDAATHPVSVESRLRLDAGGERLALEQLQVRQPGLIDLQAQGDLRLSGTQPIERLELKLQPVAVEPLYGEMLQPVLAGTPWGRFELAGRIGLDLSLRERAIRLDLKLDDFSLDDAPGEGAPRRLGLYDVNGVLHWDRGGEARPSHLAWRAGQLLERIDLGPGEVDFEAGEQRFRLTRSLHLPVLDGALVVDRLEVASPGELAQRLQFDGYIEPISMDALSQALGWVPLSGKLSGMIPGLTYEGGLLSVDGVLLVRLFDGDILINRLKLRELFGVYPELSADIELRHLDLESLTRTFSFGRITGRLDGYVRDLKMEAWRPVAFDARFFTPGDDDSRRRISQKAVDNISNLGGAGLSGSLARTFMGIFEEFRYKRIGIGCRLRQEVCEMVGARAAEQGYYLVEGSGLPRIDIIGYNRTADWSRLVDQLKQITESGGPIIQ